MKSEKILRTITSAISHLEDSMEAFAKNKETALMDNLWRAAADLEYALFLFSLKHQDEARSSAWKLDSHSKQSEIEPILVSTKDLLETAEESIKANNFLEAHKKAWLARGQLLRVHDTLEKSRKSGK